MPTETQLPAVQPGATSVAKVAIGVGTALAAMWYPAFALAAPVLALALERHIERPQRMLIDSLRAGGIVELSDEQAAEFVPMAYRFMEAAREGEFERNLRILGSFIAGELKLETPVAGNVARMARRLEALSADELYVIALLNEAKKKSTKEISSATMLDLHKDNPDSNDWFPQERFFRILPELAGRGFLVADGATRYGKHEEYYYYGDPLTELISKAGDKAIAG